MSHVEDLVSKAPTAYNNHLKTLTVLNVEKGPFFWNKGSVFGVPPVARRHLSYETSDPLSKRNLFFLVSREVT